jgi:hypothetical protein
MDSLRDTPVHGVREHHHGKHENHGYSTAMILDGINDRIVVHLTTRGFDPKLTRPLYQADGDQPEQLGHGTSCLRPKGADEQPKHHHRRQCCTDTHGPEHD